MRHRAPTAAVASIESILSFAESRLVGARSILAQGLRLKLSAALADARVPAVLIPKLLGRTTALLDEPQLGLRLAIMGDPRRHGLLDYLAATSPTLGAAWSQICRYLGLWNEGLAIRQTLGPTDVALELRPTATAPGDEAEGMRQLLGLATTTLILAGHRYAGQPVPPRCVEFACDRPAHPEQWATALGAPVNFAVPLTRIVYPSLTTEIISAASDTRLAPILGRHADDLLARLGERSSLSGKVRDAIVAELRRGEVQLAAIAMAMGVSERTLQRRLRDEGTSFEALLDETRFELASSYLRDPAIGISEIAWLVGYTEISAFYRAFGRWTGTTPGTYRARLT
jgi:AraC-like DNA-binding protein